MKKEKSQVKSYTVRRKSFGGMNLQAPLNNNLTEGEEGDRELDLNSVLGYLSPPQFERHFSQNYYQEVA